MSDIDIIHDIPFPEFDDSFAKENDKNPCKRLLSNAFLASTASSTNLTINQEYKQIKNQPIPTIDIFDVIPRITPETMVDLIDDVYKKYFDKIIILDCRFKYEYDGGHIKDAINVESDDHLKKLFFNENLKHGKICFVFHCELSQNRGPQLAKLFREFDRTTNFENYPNLTYPYLYVLDGGYRKFYSQYQSYCTGGYVRMYSKANIYNGTLQQSVSKFRKSFDYSKRNQQAQTLPPFYHPTFF